MIIQKTIEKNGNDYILYYSDRGYRIYQVETGNIYNSALDNILVNYTYEETNQPRTDLKQNQVEEYKQIIDILTGQAGEE